MQMKYIPPPSAVRPPGLLRKTTAIMTTIALAGVALMFSAILLTSILIIAAIGGIYVWWKTRELRRQMRDFHPFPENKTFRSDVFAREAVSEKVIEGEAIRVDESRAGGRR